MRAGGSTRAEPEATPPPSRSVGDNAVPQITSLKSEKLASTDARYNFVDHVYAFVVSLNCKYHICSYRSNVIRHFTVEIQTVSRLRDPEIQSLSNQMSPFRVVPIGPTRRHNAPTPGRPATRSSSETREDTTRQSHVPQWPPSRPSTPRSSARVATSRTRAPHPPPPNRCSRAPPGTSPSAPPMVRPVPDHVSLNAPVPDRSRTHASDRTPGPPARLKTTQSTRT